MNFEPPTKDGTELADGQHHADAAKLAGTRINIRTHNFFEPIEELQLEGGGQLKRLAQNAAGVLEFGAASGVMQAKMADAHKAIGEERGQGNGE